MDSLRNSDSYDRVTFNALQSNVNRRSISGTPIEIYGSQKRFYGYLLNNNDASARWVQIFFRPSSGIVLGTTAPDMTVLMPASGSVALELENPLDATTGITVACTTTEVGATGATSGATGVFLFAR